MAPKKRIWYPDALYHITNRGNRKSDLFRDREDYKAYLFMLKQAMARYRCRIYSYCLMTNHVHLQIQTTDLPIGKFMRDINYSYAVYFNQKYNLVGHLFEARYKAEIIEDDAYTLQASRYIHLNPARANMVKKAEMYPWSSYGIYTGLRENNFVSLEMILGHFKECSRDLYREFVESEDPLLEGGKK